MHDSRLPLVNWNLTMRRGSHSNPVGKEGLASLTASMLRRGAGGLTYAQMNDELESHGISLDVEDAGDCTRLTGLSTTDELDRGMTLSRDVLLSPSFPADEFAKLQEETVNNLAVSLDTPTTVADQDMMRSLFGGSPLGRPPTPASVSAITLDDVKNFYSEYYRPNDAILIISGDVTLERGQALAKQLTDGWAAKDLPPVDYTFKPMTGGRKIILVDRPVGKGATIRIGIRAYDIHTDEKYAGSLAGTILSAGIESRLMRYVRAEKGYVYGVRGTFQPGRYIGSFQCTTDTRLETTADTIEAIFKVLNDMRAADVPQQELDEAKRRVSGSMVMSMETIAAQAGLRSDGILNGYPIDYYDVYPSKISAVTADQIRAVMNKYVDDSAMTIVVVAPASETLEQLKRLGDVQVIPMPAKRGAATQPAAPDLLKPAT